MTRVLLLLLLLCASCLAAPNLEDKEVLLIVSSQRGDLDGEWLELNIRSMRHELGLNAAQLPVVRMGFRDPDARPELFERLNLKPEQSPILCLVKWAKPASEGPLRVVNDLLLTDVTKAQGLEAPRSIMIGWLERNNKKDLISIIQPPEPEVIPKPTDEKELQEVKPEPVELPASEAESPAQLALDDGKYTESIILARQSGNKGIEDQAKEILQKQALIAVDEEREELAISVYKSLSELYPDDPYFEKRIKELSQKPVDFMIGTWKMNSSSGWIKFTALENGQLSGKGALHILPIPGKMEGHWELTGDKERTFQLHWKNGLLHNIKIHENGESFEGRGVTDGNVSGRRLEPE